MALALCPAHFVESMGPEAIFLVGILVGRQMKIGVF